MEVKGFYAPQTNFQTESLIYESEVWEHFLCELIERGEKIAAIYCIIDEGL